MKGGNKSVHEEEVYKIWREAICEIQDHRTQSRREMLFCLEEKIFYYPYYIPLRCSWISNTSRDYELQVVPGSGQQYLCPDSCVTSPRISETGIIQNYHTCLQFSTVQHRAQARACKRSPYSATQAHVADPSYLCRIPFISRFRGWIIYHMHTTHALSYVQV